MATVTTATTTPVQVPATPTSFRYEIDPIVLPAQADETTADFSIENLSDLVPILESKRGLGDFIEKAGIVLALASESQQRILLHIIVSKIRGNILKTFSSRAMLSWKNLKQFLMNT